MTRPTCPNCSGIGWVQEPHYSDFAPSTRPAPCPLCNSQVTHVQLSWLEIGFLLGSIGLAFAILNWVAS